MHFPNIERYDKVLTDAAVLSRRYLNSIFTRKDAQLYQPDFQPFFHTRKLLHHTTHNFTRLLSLARIATQQQDLVEDIFAAFREIRGGLGFGVQPVSFSTPKLAKQMGKFAKILAQADEAFVRWEVLNETVRELQCNLYKGLHEDNAFYEAKAKQLKQWAHTLNLNFLEIIKKGEELMEAIGKHLVLRKKEQHDLCHPTE